MNIPPGHYDVVSTGGIYRGGINIIKPVTGILISFDIVNNCHIVRISGGKLIQVQRGLSRLIEAACEAEECFDLDELEKYAEGYRQGIKALPEEYRS